ncbi:MAG: hypothetical protein ABW095_18745 [Candidatus Thiodiazotropha sp.]
MLNHLHSNLLICLLLVSVSGACLAEDECYRSPTDSALLPEIAAASRQMLATICAGSDEDGVRMAYTEFVTQITHWFDPYGGFQQGKLPSMQIRSMLDNPAISTVSVGVDLEGNLTIGVDPYVPADPERCDSVAAERVRHASCSEVIDEFVDLYTLAQNDYQALLDKPTLDNIVNLRKRWEPFLDQMRGQTLLELFVNGKLYRSNSERFEEPPSSQIILLHPVLLYENVNAAVDGENSQEALGIELLGMNWWRQDKWYIPSGGSLLTVYSDRKDVQDWGLGVALHFRSVYTVGYTNHGGDDGIFVSLDFLKLFQDKKKAFDEYKGNF